MQRQHDAHEGKAVLRVERTVQQHVAGARVHAHGVAGNQAVARLLGHADEGLRLVRIEGQVVDHFGGVHGAGLGHQLVEVGARRAGGHVRQGLAVVQPMLYLVVEHQRQAGQADDQQERRTDQAGPFVDHIPGFDGGGGGHGMGTAEGRKRGPRVCRLIGSGTVSRIIAILVAFCAAPATPERSPVAGEPAVVSARFQSGLKVSLAAPCGWRPPAAPGGVRACPPPWNTMQQPFLRILATSPAATSRWAMCMGISRLRQSLDRLGFDPALDRLFSVGDLVDRGRRTNRCWTGCGSPGSTRCKAITRTTRSTTSAAARWTR